MGKPADAADAESMLRALSGDVHEVHTAVVVRAVAGGRQVEEVVTTRVRFSPLTDAEIAWYIATGEAEGKAGRLRHPGPGGAVHRPDRRLLVERRRAADLDGLPAADRGRCRDSVSGAGYH